MLRGFPVAAPLLLALSLLAPCAALQLPSGSVTAVRRPAASTRAPLVQALEAEDEDEKAPAAAPAPAAPAAPVLAWEGGFSDVELAEQEAKLTALSNKWKGFEDEGDYQDTLRSGFGPSPERINGRRY